MPVYHMPITSDLVLKSRLSIHFEKKYKGTLKKVLYLSVRVFSTVVLIVYAVNKQTNITNRSEVC